MDPACGEGEETRKTQKRRRFCAKCQKHDVLEEVKGHKNRCLYRWCQCQKCWPVDVKRNNTRINVKQRRDAILEKELAAKRARAAWESYKSASTSPPGGQGKPPAGGSPPELSGTQQGRHPILPPPPSEASAPELGEPRPGERLPEVPPPPALPLPPIHMEVEIPGGDIPTPHHRPHHQDMALERRLSAIRLSPGAVVAGGELTTGLQPPPPLLQPSKEDPTSLLDPRILRPPHKKSLVETERRSCGGSPGLQPEPAHLCKEPDLLPPDPCHHRSRHNHKGGGVEVVPTPNNEPPPPEESTCPKLPWKKSLSLREEAKESEPLQNALKKERSPEAKHCILQAAAKDLSGESESGWPETPGAAGHPYSWGWPYYPGPHPSSPATGPVLTERRVKELADPGHYGLPPPVLEWPAFHLLGSFPYPGYPHPSTSYARHDFETYLRLYWELEARKYKGGVNGWTGGLGDPVAGSSPLDGTADRLFLPAAYQLCGLYPAALAAQGTDLSLGKTALLQPRRPTPISYDQFLKIERRKEEVTEMTGRRSPSNGDLGPYSENISPNFSQLQA